MLDWLEHMYVTSRIEDSGRIRENIGAGRPVPGVFLVTLSHNPHNLCEILPAMVLVQKAARKVCPRIIGMAKGKEDAIRLVEQLLVQVYQKTGGFDLASYVTEEENPEGKGQVM